LGGRRGIRLDGSVFFFFKKKSFGDLQEMAGATVDRADSFRVSIQSDPDLALTNSDGKFDILNMAMLAACKWAER